MVDASCRLNSRSSAYLSNRRLYPRTVRATRAGGKRIENFNGEIKPNRWAGGGHLQSFIADLPRLQCPLEQGDQKITHGFCLSEDPYRNSDMQAGDKPVA
jgi:hypothetical protein